MSIPISLTPRSSLHTKISSTLNGREKLLPTTQENPGPVKAPSCFSTAILSWVRVSSVLWAARASPFLKNYAQEVDMVGQGRFPVGIGLSDGLIEERTKRGVPIVILDPRQLKEG